MQKPNSTINRLNRAFLLQGGLIAAAAILSVFFATIVIDKILIKQAIKQEADYFWERYQTDANFPLPNTSNLSGYFDNASLPENINTNVEIPTGFTEFQDQQGKFVLYTSQQNNKKLYLVYSRGEVDKLAAYYGLAPLAFVLMVLYLSVWVAYRFSHRAISPITWLANQVNKLDFRSADFSPVAKENLPYNTDDDIRVLSDAIFHLGERLESFIARERNFTRDASHELRSPLTVISIAADMLLSEQQLAIPAKNSVFRIKRAIADMEELIEAFLLLARESDQALPTEIVCINDILGEEIERSKILIENKPLTVNYTANYQLKLNASEKVLSIMFGNIIRNAILYTSEGSVDITLTKNSVLVKDSGEGMARQQVKHVFKPYYRGKSDSHGYGVGLTIVKRLSDRFNWPINIKSAIGTGTSIEILFPEADVVSMLSTVD